MDAPAPPWIEVLRTPESKRAGDAALLLAAVGIAFEETQDGADHVLAVPPAERERAALELERYAVENRGWPPVDPVFSPLTDGALGAFAWALLLALCWHLQSWRAFGFDWMDRGSLDVAAVRAGEWFRTVTALTLHVDVLHLASNVVFGALFAAALCQRLGTGVASLAMVLAGAVGNAANALLRNPPFVAVGASTAVFAAVGLLAAHTWRQRRRSRATDLSRRTPLLIGVALLAMLGFSAGRTDVLGHVLGFAAGSVLGAVLGGASAPVRRRGQRACLAATLALLALAWATAFLWA